MHEIINVLIIVDEPLLLDDLTTFSRKYLFEFEVVNSAQDALRIHEIGRFDIIYMDLASVSMSGSEFIKNIRNYDQNQEFIFLCSEEDDKELFTILKQDASFVTKPINYEKFKKTTNKTIQLIQNSINCEPVRNLQAAVNTISNQNDLQNNLLTRQSKLAQTGEMISMIAHQWRQPLSVITSITAAIQTRIELDLYRQSKTPYEQLEYDLRNAFERIEESADFLSKTINDFRNFYRPERGISTFSASELIHSVCRMALLDKDQLSIDLKLIVDDSIVLTSFENELKQVLINIINNAKDVFKEKMSTKSKLRISLTKGGEFAYINIADNGGGINPDILEEIFLPYYSTKSEKNGTGIGLHMSKTIIENHIGGKLSVTNNDAFGGADFCIKIPLSRQEHIA